MYEASAAYDAKDGSTVLFGGYNATLGYVANIYGFTGGTWNSLTVAVPTPSGRTGEGQFAYDAADRSIVLFGGEGNSLTTFSDTWTYN
jgi:hypothetical protein